MSLTGAQKQRLEELVDEIVEQRCCQLVAAAQVVVAARYSKDDGAWEKLKEAIGQLEDIVGRPE